jgi:hypothetical protein
MTLLARNQHSLQDKAKADYQGSKYVQRQVSPLGLIVAGAVAVLCCASVASGTPLLGDYGAAINNAEAVVDNPANAGFLPYTSVAAVGETFKIESVAARYPGLDPISVNNSGVAIPLSRPGAILKLTPRLGVGGIVVPPLPIQFDVTKKKLPIVLLNSKFQVDAKIGAELLGYASFAMGWRLADKFGIGIGGEYGAAKFSAQITESSSGSELATVSGNGALGSLTIGSRLDLAQGRVAIGVAVTALQLLKADVDLKSPLVDTSGEAGNLVKDATQGLNSQQTFSSGLAGIKINLTRRLVLMGELRYTRSDPTQETISLVTFKKQPKDVQDTVAVRTGGIIKLNPRLNLLGGFRYEPSAVGAGTVGANARGGYGSLEFLPAAAGITPLSPFYMLAGGVQMALWPGGRQPGTNTPPWRVVVEGGFTFTESSVGIDETGELPGAYYYRKLAGVGGIRVYF